MRVNKKVNVERCLLCGQQTNGLRKVVVIKLREQEKSNIEGRKGHQGRHDIHYKTK